MPQRLPSSALGAQTQITASSTGAVLAGTWYIGSSGLGSAGTVAGTLNGPLTGTADYAKALSSTNSINGKSFPGNSAVTVPINTTAVSASGTYRPVFVPSNTAGNQDASTSAGLSYDPATGTLSSTIFSGSGSGLTGVVRSITFNGSAVTLDANGVASFSSPAPPAQVQSDWNQLTTTATDYIKNKPAIPSLTGYATETYVGNRGYITSSALVGYATETYVGNRGYITSSALVGYATETYVGNQGFIKSAPTAVSNLTQDTVLYGEGGYTYGMGVVPGYTYTIANGAVDEYTDAWSVPTTGWWSFTSISIKAAGSRLNCTGWLSTTAYLIGCLEVNISGFGWRTVATRSWDAINVLNSLTADGSKRKVGESATYFSGGLGWGTNDAQGNNFRKPYYLSAGAGVRFRFLWATTLPSHDITNNDTGILDSTDVFNPIIVPPGSDYQWRAYWTGGDTGYWYVGCHVQWTAVRTG